MADVGIGCETVRCNADEVRYDARCRQKGVGGDEKALPNFLAGEEEQPLERQLDLDLDLAFNTVNHSRLDALLRPDGWHHAGVCKDVVI